STDNFVDNSIEQIQSRSGAGRFGCYELVFPVTLQFADSTTATVNSYEELREAIRTWFETNGANHNHHSRPTLVYPYQVTNDAGEIITVENDDQLKELLAACRPGPGGPGNGGNNGGHGNGHGNHGGGDACYTLVFPITIQFPDSTLAIVASQEEFREAVHTWKQNNPNTLGRPELVFPITVTLKDGTQAVVNSKEELQAIKDACRG
ncbi:MAG TPA: hypothetical protein VFV79_00040, partial [Saprospiraceae bacterium]|nr:hypothetical protein [Saprospiraceae bacterium]